MNMLKDTNNDLNTDLAELYREINELKNAIRIRNIPKEITLISAKDLPIQVICSKWKYNTSEIEPTKNSYSIKPEGGVWTSPCKNRKVTEKEIHKDILTCEGSEWVDFVEKERSEHCIIGKLNPELNLIKIDNRKDYLTLINHYATSLEDFIIQHIKENPKLKTPEDVQHLINKYRLIQCHCVY